MSVSRNRGKAFFLLPDSCSCAVPGILPLYVSMVVWLTVFLPCVGSRSKRLHAHDGSVFAFLAKLHDSLGKLGRRGRGRVRPHLGRELFDLADQRRVALP